MDSLHLICHSREKLLQIVGETLPQALEIRDASGKLVAAPELRRNETGLWLDAAALEFWSPATPVLYTLAVPGGETIRFGFSQLETCGNSMVLLNGTPIYLRGYIRGITAHEHPNMTGASDYEAACKNIRQAKKFGFNLVRFHSTIPSEDFVRAADELGLFIHMEIGFAYDYGPQGKTGLAMDNQEWHDSIMRFRNNPSIAIFCIGNEMHNSGHLAEVHKLYRIGRELAPAKLIMDNSGWGEYDRTTADIYSQHIAYYFPYKHHQEMFKQDFCWHMNGSVNDAPMELKTDAVEMRRHATPLRPVLAHEAVHYIEVPDYQALNDKFDAFCAKVGPEYLKRHGIKKPRFMTELPALIRRKGLEQKYPDYITASEIAKRCAVKVYLERLRLAPLCGYEMLQFADCLKYENKNGIVDCFDDDKKFLPAEWVREFNSDTVLLADFSDDVIFESCRMDVKLCLSHFAAPANTIGDLVVKLDGEELCRSEKFTTVNGLQELVEVKFFPKAGVHTLSAEFRGAELKLTNSWKFWVYPEVMLADLPAHVVETDKLTDDIFSALEAGKTVLLHYHRDTIGNTYYWPGSLDRFKPCIWDRGSNLGGIVNAPWAQQALLEKFFDRNMQSLLEGAYKLNLDHFPKGVAEELISGVDKPVRDRMKGLVNDVKDFIDDDTLRNFCYLLAMRVGKGKLVVSTLNRGTRPGMLNFQKALREVCASIEPAGSGMSVAELRNYLAAATAAGPIREDVMNHFWEIDNKPVEDTLFWEASGLDLAKIK